MSDDKTIRGLRDALRINVNEDYEVRYWTETLRLIKISDAQEKLERLRTEKTSLSRSTVSRVVRD